MNISGPEEKLAGAYNNTSIIWKIEKKCELKNNSNDLKVEIRLHKGFLPDLRKLYVTCMAKIDFLVNVYCLYSLKVT